MQAKSILTGAALVLAALFILDVPPARAETTTWDGSDSVNWTLAANWDNGVPEAGDIVIIPIGELNNEPTVNVATPALASVTIQSGRTVTVDAAMTVTGTITVNNGGTLTMNSGDVTCGSLTVSGTVTTGANTLTVGTITINDGGILTQNSALTVGTLTVNTGGTIVVNAALTVTTLTVDGTMTMNANVTVTSSCTVAGTVTTNANTLWIAGVLTIECDGTLTISANGTVHLDGAVTHLIAGTIYLSAATSILHFDDNATLDGYDCGAGEVNGTIDGQHNSAQITIAASKTLTNEITIKGALTIAGGSNATFDNDGTVWANDGTTANTRDCLTLDSGTFTGSGTYEVNRTIGWNAAYLEFDESGVTATGLGTCFIVSNGTLDIYTTTVTTTGGLSFTGGNIVLASGCTFTASGTCP